MILSPEEWAAIDAVKSAIVDGLPKITCPLCGKPMRPRWRVEPAQAPEPASCLAKATTGRVRVVATGYARFCSIQCDLRFVQERVRKDGPHARLSCKGCRSSFDRPPSRR